VFWSSFSVHHYHIFFLYRLQLTLTKTCIWDLPFIYPFLLWISFFFWFVKLTGFFLYVFSKDLMVSFVDLIFQVYKCLKWRVQPQSSFLSSKQTSLEMLFLFFLHFICSSSSVHHVCFVYRLQLMLKKSWIWDLPFICPFLLWISFFFWFLKLTGIFLYVFYKDLMVSLLDLIFQCVNAWNEEYNHNPLLSSKKPSLAMLFLFFLNFICSSSSVHHLSFVYSLQLKTTNTFIWYFPLIFFFFVKTFFFCFSTELVWLFMFFYWDLMVSWLHLMFQVFKCFKWRVQPQTSFLTTKKSSLAMLYLFFWAFCSSSSSVLLFSISFFLFAFSSQQVCFFIFCSQFYWFLASS